MKARESDDSGSDDSGEDSSEDSGSEVDLSVEESKVDN